ncbi:MAG: hypothetical protein AB1736_03195 [Chloroflexota bacterium]
MGRRSGLSMVAALSLVAAGCGSARSPAVTDPVVIETPSPNEDDAVRIRTEFGLRADIPFIRAVAADPRSSSLVYSVPLLPDEIAELNARAANADAIREVVIAYTAAHSEEFGGIYLDQEHGRGALTTLWTGHLDEHEAAIRALVHPDARIAFRLVEYTDVELHALQDRIAADWEWMRAFEIAPMGVGVDVLKNLVEVDVSSANPDAARLILEHYDVVPGMVQVISDGTGAALIPGGTIRGRVVDWLGQPPGEQLAGELSL